jgi:nitrite reductase (NO-forming)
MNRDLTRLFRKRAPIVAALILVGASSGLAIADSRDNNINEPVKSEERAVLTYAPDVPSVITRNYATKVVIHLEVREVEDRLADGVQYTFWTFGGKVPGKFIRVREGDLVEFHLDNHPDNKMPHNIDLHAVIGQGGGAASSLTAPGHSSVFSFKALVPGLYVYHCATAPVAMHVGNGMYGLIYVQPKKPLPRVTHEYYVMQGDFYTKGSNGEQGLQPFSMEKALAEKPEYVVFNGSVGALSGDNALKAKVGDTVRLFVGNGGPNLTSSFHVIGEIFDTVWQEGNTSAPIHNVQTTMIPAGGAAIVEFKINVPGTFLLVDHSLTRAFNRGALGQLKATGPENKLVYSGKISDEVYLPEGTGIRVTEQASKLPAPAATNAERIKLGEAVFKTNCMACHQESGQGIPGAFPPLAQSDYLNGDKVRAIKTVIGGRQGSLTVNGAKFDGVMPAWTLSDEDIANVLSYAYGSWGNSGKDVTPADVKAARAELTASQPH